MICQHAILEFNYIQFLNQGCLAKIRTNGEINDILFVHALVL